MSFYTNNRLLNQKEWFEKRQRINKNLNCGKPESFNPNPPQMGDDQSYINSFSTIPSNPSYSNQGYVNSFSVYHSPQYGYVNSFSVYHSPQYVYNKIENQWYYIPAYVVNTSGIRLNDNDLQNNVSGIGLNDLQNNVSGIGLNDLQNNILGIESHDLQNNILGIESHDLQNNIPGIEPFDVHNNILGIEPFDVHNNILGIESHDLQNNILGIESHDLQNNILGIESHDLQNNIPRVKPNEVNNYKAQSRCIQSQESLDGKTHNKEYMNNNISEKSKMSTIKSKEKKKVYNSSVEFKIVNYNNKGSNIIDENEDKIIVTYSDYDGSKISTKENKDKVNDNSKGSSRNNSKEKCSEERSKEMKLKVIFKDLLNYYSNLSSMRIQQKYVSEIVKGKKEIKFELLYHGDDNYEIEMSFLNEKKKEIFSKEIKFNCHIENMKNRNYENSDIDGIIDFSLIHNNESNKCIEIPLSENAIEGRKKIKLLLNDFSSNIRFVEIRQTSMKEIFEKEESCIIELNTDQGDYKYVTSISFLNDKENILFSKNFKIGTLKSFKKEKKEFIEILKKGVDKNDIIRTFKKVGDPKELVKDLKRRKNKEFKNEKFKNDLNELSNKNDMKEIYEYCVDHNNNNSKQINSKLLVLCFEYVYMKIISIDKLNITQYLYGSLEEWKKFLIKFQVSVDCKNIIVIFTENGRKRNTESKDDTVENKRKKQKIDPSMDDNMKNSEYESHIS